MTRFNSQIFEYLNTLRMMIRAQPLNLGGAWGSGGGGGGPPGGFTGYLPQNRVSFDTAEISSLAYPVNPSGLPSGASLVHNLNRIRYWINQKNPNIILRDEGVPVASGVSVLDFNSGAEITIPETGVVIVDIAGGGISVYENDFIRGSGLTGINFEGAQDVTVSGLIATVVISGAGGGGGPHALDDHTDVTITSVADNELLAYDSSSGEWINQTPSEADLREIIVRVDSGSNVGPRPRLNLIPGSGVSIVAIDDPSNDEIDITIVASGAGGGTLDVTTETLRVIETIHEETLSSPGQFTISGIPATYDDLYITIICRSDDSTGAYDALMIYYNNDTTATNYGSAEQHGGTAHDDGLVDDPRISDVNAEGGGGLTSEWTYIKGTIINYSGGKRKVGLYQSGFGPLAAQAGRYTETVATFWESANAINRLDTDLVNGTDLVTGSYMRVDGCKEIDVVTNVELV